MVDIKAFISALKLKWLKRILNDNGKLSKVVSATCMKIFDVKMYGGEFANVIMKQCINPFWVDVFKHYKKLCDKCIPKTFDDFASENLYYNVHICRDYKIISLNDWLRNGVIKVGDLMDRHGYLTFDAFKRKFPGIVTNFLMYRGVIHAVKRYQLFLNCEADSEFVTEDSLVWKCLSNGGVRHIYSQLIHCTDEPKAIQKWCETLDVQINVRNVFLRIMHTTAMVPILLVRPRMIVGYIGLRGFWGSVQDSMAERGRLRPSSAIESWTDTQKPRDPI
jgi:hypothetical protein